MIHHGSPSQATPAQTEGRLIRWAISYDFVMNILALGQAERLRNLTIDLALLKPGDSLLDVGCGTGGVTLPARQRVGPGGKSAGIDPAPEMIAVARRKAERKRLDIDFRVGVIEALPFPDSSFDVVTASLMVHHLPEHLQREGFREIYRVLKPGGRFLIADLIRSQSPSSLSALPALLMHHFRLFDAAGWLDLLKEAGFQEASQLDQRFSAIGFLRAIK
jgi:ubiquinone/menaquinone biosynthesis C-methylase UbiE